MCIRDSDDTDAIKGTYLDNYKNVFDLYITDSTCDGAELSAKTADEDVYKRQLLTCGLIIFLMLMMNRQMSGGGGGTNAKMMNFGKSRARMSMPDDKDRKSVV